ncbi:hypothetical protein BJ912DRAFT_972030 [Pholiota molesta]|nr:hypothetical protein BJ912DRAFT_972030 [Pholiota molesta]
MFSRILLLTPFFIASTLAANDWSTPCHSGVCEYDLPATNSSASGTLKIWSSNAAAISDITPAAGWMILGCAPDMLEQEIRLVDSETGAVGKVIRLPENCGKGPFAVVTNMYMSQDQSLPASLSRRATGSNATVQGLSISTKFAGVGTPSTGPVNFAIRAANLPGAGGDLAIPTQQQRRASSRAFRFPRGLTNFIEGAVNDVTSLNDFNVNKSTTLPPFDLDKPFNLVDQSVSCPPVKATVKIDVDAKAHAVASIGLAASGTILPPTWRASRWLLIDGSVTMAADASGTLDSGKITLFEVGVPGLDFPGILTIGPSFKVEGQATATLDVGVELTVGLSYTINGAQLVFPPNSGTNHSKGVFNIGDTPLKLSATPSASATGTLAAHLIPSLNLGLSALGDTVSATVFLELDASASMTLSAQAQANASTTVGRRALRYSRDVEKMKARQSDGEDNGVNDSSSDADDASSDDADEYSDADPFDWDAAYASGANAGSDAATSTADASNNATSINSATDATMTDSATDASTANYTADTTMTATIASPTASAGTASKSPKALGASAAASTSFGGCVEIDANLDVNAGATGSFFGLFDATTKVDLFQKKFEIFKKCFGSQPTRRSLPNAARRELLSTLPRSHSLLTSAPQRRAFSLQCPSADENANGGQQSLVNETVAASS